MFLVRDKGTGPSSQKNAEVKMMAKQKGNNNAKQQKNNDVGSGSRYHEKHASHVPDYGANSMDPNAKGYK